MTEPKQYTTAIIAAVPAVTDPIHAIVAEDAHITLQFLGEASELTDEQVSEIEQALQLVAANVYPFQADISGTAELGPDKAKVLIVQSALLTKIRETLGLGTAVSTAVNSVEQFPNWIPHLTLAYQGDGEMPDDDAIAAFKEVTIGSLELWMAEEHKVFDLSAPVPAVTAAGETIFEEGLHPRGADGRFIEKFGVIKYLTGLGWQYGKVEGIYHDKASGAVKLTVTPSDLSGTSHGAENIVLSPKQVYHAPSPKAHLPISAPGAQKIGGQGGSNPGGLYSIPPKVPSANAEPEQYYVKKPKTKTHGNNEALANALYEEAGVPVPAVDMHADGQLYSKIVQGKQDMASQLGNPEWTDQIQRNFAVDAWLGNRDVFGMTYDNVLTDEHGTAWRIDNGGALLFRAMGEKKTDFGSKVTELDSFRQGKKAKIFGAGMTKAQELDGAERVLAISPGQIDDMVQAHNLPKSLADTLKARRAYIASYYGLELPESKTPEGAVEPTSAPLVDAADLAENGGKNRSWFKVALTHLGFFAQVGDSVEFANGKSQQLGIGEDGSPLSNVGLQSQLLGLQQKHGLEASVFLKKGVPSNAKRPEHGSMLAASDLAAQNWQRGDVVVDNDGIPWKIQGWNPTTGAVLLKFGNTSYLADTFGKDASGVYKVERWDPPAVDTPAPPIQTEQQAISVVEDDLTSYTSTPNGGYVPAPAPEIGKSQSVLTLEDLPLVTPAPQTSKTGQAAVAEAQIKADLDQPLPTGNGTPNPAVTSAPGGAKVMVIGDGTQAATGDAVTSKKDGKTYTFVKPKGNYAVVTDPNSETPDKQLLKLASTMTQPGKVPAPNLGVMEAPKTATGEVPAIGMKAVAKDGWAGEITLISPDGKFVFITNANGVRKRKSVGTVSITGKPEGVPDAPKKTPGSLKDYGVAPKGKWVGDEKVSNWATPDTGELGALSMVHVGYADGTDGLEPYVGQPLDTLETNVQGKVAVYGSPEGYLGPMASDHLAAAGKTGNGATTYQVIASGNIFYTDGQVGPHGGLVLWYAEADQPGTDAFELPPTPQPLTVISSAAHSEAPLTMPDGISFQEHDPEGNVTLDGPLYSDEAKTLADWKGQIVQGSEISLDGKNWLTVEQTFASGGLGVLDINGGSAYLNAWSSATYVVKAPGMKNGDDTTSSPFMGEPSPAVTVLPDLPVSTSGSKKIADLAKGDVVLDQSGNTTVVDSITLPEHETDSTYLKALGEDWGSPADPNTELTYLGNIHQGPVSVPVGEIAPHLYPGAKLELGSDWGVQVASYPEQLANGNYRFAAFTQGSPNLVSLIEVGDAPSADISGGVAVPTHLDAYTTWQDAGVDIAQMNALFDTAKTQDPNPQDHYWDMTQQGIEFGKAQYPIYFNAASGTYFRPAHSGIQEWDAEGGQWNNAFGTVGDKEKVWDGKPFEGTLTAPSGYPEKVIAVQAGLSEVLANYKPKPGETLQLAKATLADESSILISYPFGLEGPAHTVLQHQDGSYYTSSDSFNGDWKNSGAFSDLTTIHDPFADTPAPVSSQITHHEGPTPPPDLGTALNEKGYSPQPGEQMLVVTQPSTGKQVILVKQPDGNYKAIQYSGNLGQKLWTAEEVKAMYPGSSSYSWTYIPEGTSSPATVQGMPSGFQPYVPGEGQSVLKVTLANGKENVYLQKQPGAGWYEMGPDGTVAEGSDAVKSDHIVQAKLAGKGSQAAKYELLHPLPEGDKKQGDPVPEFSNSSGSWTPEPHQKVVALHSYKGDSDPWYFTQDEPGGPWVPAPINQAAGVVTDIGMQDQLSQEFGSGAGYTLVYDGAGHAAVDTPGKALASFSGYTPKEGEKVLSYHSFGGNGDIYYYVQKPGDKHWHGINPDGTITDHISVHGDDLPANLGAEHGNDYAMVWPPEEATSKPEAPAAPAAPPTFDGYTPKEGDKVFTEPNGSHWVLTPNDGKYHAILNDGKLTNAGMSQADWDDDSTVKDTPQAWPPVDAAPDASGPAGGTFNGYATKASDNVLSFTAPNGATTTVISQPDGSWSPIVDGGQLATGITFSQEAIDWAVNPDSGMDAKVLQGYPKPLGGAAVTAPLPTSNSVYAGVSGPTPLAKGSYHFGSFSASQAQQDKLDGLTELTTGQSIYLLNDPNDTANSAVVTRFSDGSWKSIGYDGFQSNLFDDDEDAEAWIAANNYTLHKAQFGAPQSAPAPVQTYSGPTIYGWKEAGIPDPASFGFLADPADAAGLKAGDWLYIQGATTAANNGLFVQLAQDVPKTGTGVKISTWAKVDGGTVGEFKTPSSGAAQISFDLAGAKTIYAQNHAGTAVAPGSETALSAPSLPETPEPSAPVVPAYPGAVKPSQEDINAWGGSLTKDGHIPTPGMHVTGKGPMSGKIISVSKDKTKAVVLTSDGKKTTRLIEALKTDPSANYSAYAAPVTAKDIPSGMPLAVDTVAEALDKTAKDGKFRAILSGHPGVSGGQMVVTKTTAPSGKVYNRVHLTLTPAQREQLMASLSGTGEKGDWAQSSKMSENVSIGDQLPMRKSSTDNPDGTPRWKVDPETKPPTHKVTKVEDDPSGSGVKIVTMENVSTGEVITSRFHPGKSLSIYTWDPNKPKAMTKGAFSLSEVAKAQGWQNVTDGGISAIKGGADNGKLYNEPGTAVTKSALGQVSHSWNTLRNVSADGVVIETVDPKGSPGKSTTGVTVISVPQGLSETALGAALAKMGIDYRPMNQDDAKVAVRGTLRTLLSLDTSDVDTPKHFTDEQLFAQAGKTMGINDLGWQDVLVGVDESTGKTSFFWSDRARNALAAKANYNLIYRAATTANADQIVSTVKYGSASSILKKTTGMLDGSGSVGNGASASSDNGNHAGHGSYASASNVGKLPSSNSQAGYKSAGMMIYHRPEAVLGRIMDYRVGTGDVFGMGQGQGSDHLKYATSLSSVKDYFLGGGLPTEAVGFVAVQDAGERTKAIAKLKADGFAVINGRPVEDIIITKQKAATLKPDDLPPVTIPSNARPILDLPMSYDAAPAAAGGEAAA